MIRYLVLWSLSLLLLFFGFQNCGSRVDFESLPTEASASGVDDQDVGSNDASEEPRDLPGGPQVDSADPPNLVAPPDKCVKGQRLGIWKDENDDGVIGTNESYLGSIVSYSGPRSPADNYFYDSASAHPYDGPEPKGFHSNVFFYEGPDKELAFNFFFNVDEGGSKDNLVDVDITTSGNEGRDEVLLSDDGGELNRVTKGKTSQGYEGRFHYWQNTDGGVIGPFYGANFRIHVRFISTGDVSDAAFYSADGSIYSLKGQNGRLSSFIIAFENYEDCP